MPSFDINFTDGHDVVTRRVDCADPAVATEIAREAGARDWSRWQIEVLDAAASVAEIPASPIVIPFPDLDAEPG